MPKLIVGADLLTGDVFATLGRAMSAWIPGPDGSIEFTTQNHEIIEDILEPMGIGATQIGADDYIATRELEFYRLHEEATDLDDGAPNGDLEPPTPEHIPQLAEIQVRRPDAPAPAVAGTLTTQATPGILHTVTGAPAQVADLLALFMRYTDTQTRQQLDDISALRIRINDHMGQLTEAYRALNSYIHRCGNAAGMTAYQRLVEKFDVVRSFADIDSIKISAPFLIVQTNRIVTSVEIEGSRREIGRLLIGFNIKWLSAPLSLVTDRNDGIVRIWNLDREYQSENGTYQCGHVKDTYPCLGGYMSQMAPLAASGDFDQMVELMLRFVKNPEPGDAYCTHLRHWPGVVHEAT